MSTYSVNLLLQIPVPFDPAVANVWGTILNTNFSLLDSSIAGLLSKDVSGASNVVLTNVQGAPDEARYAMFNFTGALTGNVVILWPKNQSARFTVVNNTSGAYNLSLGANNGSGSPGGATATIPAGAAGLYYSDGTNVSLAVTPAAIGAAASGANSDITSLSGLTTPLSVAQGGTGAATPSAARTALGLGSVATANQTVSTSDPSGTPANGDTWLKYVP